MNRLFISPWELGVEAQTVQQYYDCTGREESEPGVRRALPGAEWEGCLSCAETCPFLITQDVSNKGLQCPPLLPWSGVRECLVSCATSCCSQGSLVHACSYQVAPGLSPPHPPGALTQSVWGRLEEPSHLGGPITQTYTPSPEVDLGVEESLKSPQ